ncbi:transcriptional regulator [Sulfuriferula plumbiphila]|uniref:Transcriptional regulator n=1 Tax=Sulfuriferula plumbiphila TaxID=171865 RepID=A0A512L4L9_9PROT|nr:transcriptional regulator CynR [Sulfuriferula plumbiphila]BBP03744.1 transcriptional regulator [Sulfuriferula plumbiphila]GEP29427.1 transcriptional regulator [Sulfuriferula plumbiphila]
MDRNIVFPRSIRYLIAVAEHHSFTRAAEVLYVSQPTLSQQIKQLEDLLDVQLLDRSGRSVRLTAAGEVYLHHARRALGEMDAGRRAIHELQDMSRGSLRLGMTPITDYLAIPLLDRFNARYPGITLSTLEMPQNDIEAALAEDRVDIGIAFSSTPSTEERSDEIENHILFIETLTLAVGKDHPLAGQQGPLSGHALEQNPLVLLNADYALRRHIDLYCLEHSLTPPIAIEATSLSVIIEIVRLGRLATILPNIIACAQHGLHSITLLPELPRHTISLICRKGAYKSPACQAFGELAAEWSAVRCQVKPGHRFRPCPLSDACVHGEFKSAFNDAFDETPPVASDAGTEAPAAFWDESFDD